jgi:hypothetical protein
MTMAEFRNAGNGGIPPSFSDETVSRVGRAAGQVASIRDAYRQGLNELDDEDEKEELGQQAETAAVKAISEQGLSIDEYHHVVNAAGEDPALRERLVAAAQDE